MPSRLLAVLGLSLTLACRPAPAEGPQTLRLYSTVTEATVNAVIEGFVAANPGVTVDLFRAATGEVSARIAAELREGGIEADVLWLTDPLSMQQYEADGLLRAIQPDEVAVVDPAYRSETFFGTRLLNMIIVHGNDVDDPPADWPGLAEVTGGVAIPDPAFAGSAFAALGYFALDPDYGLDYYQRLAEAGAVQVQSPTDVVTGVAEGVYAAGMTLDQGARSAINDGSPLTLVWPSSGAIAIYSPIAVVGTSEVTAAVSFVDFVLSTAGQEAIAGTGWQPIRDDVEWAGGGPVVSVDWSQAFNRQQELLDAYTAIFGG